MGEYRIAFETPWYLVLLALLPVLWVVSYRSLAGLGKVRRLLALTLRTMLVLLIVVSLAEVQLVRDSDRLTVIYLLDQSLSIPDQQRDRMAEYVNAAIEMHRERDDRAGVIVFGRQAAIEVPPFDEDVRVGKRVEAPLDPEHTNLADALKLAQASFPEDSAGRVVVVSDGNENLGDARDQAEQLASAGIGIDVVPIYHPEASGEVLVEKVTIPPDIRKGEPFDLRAVVTNTGDQPVSGRLVFELKTSDAPLVLNPDAESQRVTLKPGKNVFSIRQEVEQPNFYNYEAQFLPDDPTTDAMPQNNQATAFTHVRGSGQILLIEDFENPGEHGRLAEALRNNNLEVEVRPSNNLFTTLPELQPYDLVILGNVPREHFDDEQIRMLVTNTEHMGSGLLMVGGPNSYGAGGWSNTELEKAAPLDFHIRNAKVIPRGALALLMHASEMAQGNHWQKKIAGEALKALGERDYCGVLHWDGNEKWLWDGLTQVQDNRNKMLALIDRMTPGDMPDFDPTMQMALRGFNGLQDAAIKHMIIISDGDPSPPTGRVVQALIAAKVTVSTVAVGTHGPAGSKVMADLAADTGGKYYAVSNPNALPKIFQKEARRVARPLIYEVPPPFLPKEGFPHEMISGIGQPPALTGYVMSTIKSNPLVEVSYYAPRPAERSNALLASWTYGLGNSVCWTSDTGARWATDWTQWEGYDKFWSQLVRWTMRPVQQEGKFTITSDVADGQVRIVVTALDKDDEFLNNMNIVGKSVGPDVEPRDLRLAQVAPGRYVGTFPADQAGSYFVMLSPGVGKAPLLTGVNVPYSAEFQRRTTNAELLRDMADMVPKQGQHGELLQDLNQTKLQDLLQVNSFRHDLAKARSSQDAWHMLVLLGGCLFFFDVLVRRVHMGFAWLWTAIGWVRDKILRREAPAPVEETISRLRSRKAQVTRELDERREATSFAPEESSGPPQGTVAEELAGTARDIKDNMQRPTSQKASAEEQETYMSRLLKAKKQERGKHDKRDE